jgi:hypothetical protein
VSLNNCFNNGAENLNNSSFELSFPKNGIIIQNDQPLAGWVSLQEVLQNGHRFVAVALR